MEIKVSVPWRDVLLPRCLQSSVAQESFRPLAGMCCYPLKLLCNTERRMFPSPGGDVLLRVRAGLRIEGERVFPSPGGDVLLRVRVLFWTEWHCFRPLAGMCCYSDRLTYFPPRACFRPLAGMCCYAAEIADAQSIMFPSPGGDVLLQQTFTNSLCYILRKTVQVALFLLISISNCPYKNKISCKKHHFCGANRLFSQLFQAKNPRFAPGRRRYEAPVPPKKPPTAPMTLPTTPPRKVPREVPHAAPALAARPRS